MPLFWCFMGYCIVLLNIIIQHFLITLWMNYSLFSVFSLLFFILVIPEGFYGRFCWNRDWETASCYQRHFSQSNFFQDSGTSFACFYWSKIAYCTVYSGIKWCGTLPDYCVISVWSIQMLKRMYPCIEFFFFIACG